MSSYSVDKNYLKISLLDIIICIKLSKKRHNTFNKNHAFLVQLFYNIASNKYKTVLEKEKKSHPVLIFPTLKHRDDHFNAVTILN